MLLKLLNITEKKIQPIYTRLTWFIFLAFKWFCKSSSPRLYFISDSLLLPLVHCIWSIKSSYKYEIKRGKATFSKIQIPLYYSQVGIREHRSRSAWLYLAWWLFCAKVLSSNAWVWCASRSTTQPRWSLVQIPTICGHVSSNRHHYPSTCVSRAAFQCSESSEPPRFESLKHSQPIFALNYLFRVPRGARCNSDGCLFKFRPYAAMCLDLSCWSIPSPFPPSILYSRTIGWVF